MSKSMTRDERYSPNNRQIKREESRMFKNRQKYSHLKDDEEPKREQPKKKWRPRSEIEEE